MTKEQIHSAVNWDTPTDDFTQMFWEQNIKQFWLDTELTPSKDIGSWKALSNDEQTTYKRALGGLTLLDTKQSNVGMPKILDKVEDLQRKSVLAFMGMMEAIHAKSYSTIFTTLITKEEINGIFEWVENNKYLQLKVDKISNYYENIKSQKDLYMAITASVFLESFLFYSSFFYPLYLAGQGKMVASGEIVNLIIRDESIHGSFCGMIAQEIYNELSKEYQSQVDNETIALVEELMDNEYRYTEELYASIGLDHEVKAFLHYNANKALMNLGRESHFEEKKVNPIVLNGLNTETKTHDFFSTKGNGYQKGIYEDLRDEDFIF